MTQNMNYMSDEELELLIADVEQNELVMAPPDMLEKILEQTSNIREFRWFCFRICASVAAAVFLIFALPAVSDSLTEYIPEQEDFVMESKYATKEEALNDESYLRQKLGGNNIFGSDREWGIFNRENGG